ncbi:hypothetical protein A2641_00375 [Candidatus Nomurabacteria bacterium RIFCSPHIGHO2_01_FULL_37_25]|uniref:Uncharacterized protein n=1 Tax=Candidatus Nomurabacteria bacterium RIFCSPLOWO2_01_FULL_36_16 TaxID=1801767 RepID=A0A1F6WZD2_9BACT|nr:MAG: hypothetical protein A2641_00375 [Candidatus Nomurabacteria bacterium RIFCSPHIGHO2_01_FULL_37_25]OGI75864.1 MAG: hypothetical protein A3D36_01160 [Candidatus Nomurabacteria bacterium RIFCSPHIGHO2_02_FULL_36_29]OGI87223.1 MAG: hypothetical protein A3A91_03775 [Candidatus Nomurabacteria bacterium RIFCSPLOWO2_01_FULL_36_16]OGI95656.1 MAG: hypothetical protein A3I84_01025 [Candidatus Nomurabacteria bacterium RIFCSPLOWO2_02_FULL_36_8]
MFLAILLSLVFATKAFASLTLGSTNIISTGALTITGAGNSTWDLGSGNILSLQTTNNGAITTGTGLFTTGGSLFVTGASTITTSETVPIVIGGASTTSTLTLRSTSGVGTTNADIIFQTGNNGATEAMRILNSGFVGIGTAAPGAALDVAGNIRIGTTGNTTVYKVATGDLYFGTNPVGDYDLRLVAGGATRILLDGNTGNVGIGTTTPNANAILDVTSTTKAFMPPRMTTTQRDAIASPTAGMVIYNSSTNKLNVYTTTWEAVTSS